MSASGGLASDLPAPRRRLLLDATGIAVSAIGFGFVFGLAAREAGYTPLEAVAMSTILFAGAAQFAAVGYVAAGLPWLPILVLTLFLNARHLLYSASLAPWLVPRTGRGHRAAMAHVLTDEAFALSAAHFHRLGRADVGGYWLAAVLGVFIPWNAATLAGVLAGGTVPDPGVYGLDVVFPAAMAGLAVGLVTGRREAIAAGAGAAIGVVASLAMGPATGIVVGGLAGPLVGMAVPLPEASSSTPEHIHPESSVPLGHPDLETAFEELAQPGDGPSAAPAAGPDHRSGRPGEPVP